MKNKKSTVFELFKNNLNVFQISKKTKISRPTIKKWLIEEGFKPLTRSEFCKQRVPILKEIGDFKLIEDTKLRTTSGEIKYKWECKQCKNQIIRNRVAIKAYNTCKTCKIEKEFKNSLSKVMYNRFKKSADTRNIKFDVSREYLTELLKTQDFKCALSGNTLKCPDNPSERVARNYNISLDRIDSKKGYLKNNVQWVTKKVNLMKRTLKEEDFIKLCEQIYKYNK